MFSRSKLVICPFSGVIGSRTLEKFYHLLKYLERNAKIKGVLLTVESPGGSATASEMLYERLLAISSRKPVYAYCMMAASGGYMVSLGASRIYAPHTAALGSIGVISVKPVAKELMEKIGVGLEVLKKGKMKDMSLFDRRFTEEERASLDELNEEIYERFISIVAERRKLPLEKARALATGEVFSAKRALAEGLIDGVRGFDESLEELSKEAGVKKERAFYIGPRKPLLRKLLSGLME